MYVMFMTDKTFELSDEVIFSTIDRYFISAAKYKLFIVFLLNLYLCECVLENKHNKTRFYI